MHPLAASASPFDLFAGLPLHPLAVHVPVVLLPLGALGLLVLIVVPRWRAPLAWPIVGILGVATVGALVAKLSGEALAARVGSPGQHEQLGNWLLATSAVLFVAALAWWLWQRRSARARRSTGVMGVLAGMLLGTLALGAVIIAVLTGHSGATSVWADRVTAPPAEPAPSSPQGTDDDDEEDDDGGDVSSGGDSSSGTAISIAEVAGHDDSASCWVAIEGTVYDVTSWVTRHPGGPDRILAICGTDASEEFGAQHGGQALPTEQLSEFAIGELAER